MKNRAIKLIICVVLISCLMVGFCTTSYAIVGVGGAALLGGALASVGVDLAVTAGVGYIGYELLNEWINNGYSIKGIITGVADGYIKVNNDSVIVDGIEYQSIFLSPEMADELHTQVFDFITQNAITSNTSGILAQGVGFIDGLQAFLVNNQVRTQDYNYTMPGQYSVGNSLYTFTLDNNNYPRVVWTNPNMSQSQGSSSTKYGSGGSLYLYQNSSSHPETANTYTQWLYNNQSGTTTTKSLSSTVNLFIEESFEYDYVAGNIDATPLTSDEGFQVFVPSSQLQQAGIVVGTYPLDGGTGTDTIYDLIDLLDTIDPEQLLNPEFTEVIDPPVPPTPVPTDTPLGEVPYSQFVDTFGQSITDGLEDVNDTIGLYGEEIIDTVDTVGQSITDELQNVGNAVDTVGQSIVDELENVETGIDTLGQTLTDALDNAIDSVLEAVNSIATTLDDVIEAIMTHPLDLFSNFLDRLANIPIIRNTFDGIKQHVGIWHYVVEWLTCVGGFLGFMIRVFSDTAYCMVVPIYACVAAAICLAFYKRFGR